MTPTKINQKQINKLIDEYNTPNVTAERKAEIRRELKINYEAIRALNPNGYNVQSNDGQTWEIAYGTPTMKIAFHVNHNGTMSGPYFR